MNSRHTRIFAIPFSLLACDEGGGGKQAPADTGSPYQPDVDTGSACDTGLLDDRGECVPAACGTGTWGELELDENTVFVDIAGSEDGDGSEAAPFASIQAGLDAAGDAGGGMVAVAAGTYPELLELGRAHADVHLAGRCKELVVVDASVGDETTPGIMVVAKSSEVAISGMTVSGARYLGLLVGSGVVTIRDSQVSDNQNPGIAAYQTSFYESSISVDSCVVSGNVGLGVYVSGSGTTVSLSQTIVRDTRPTEAGSGGYGIQVSDGANLSAADCQVSGNTGVGVYAYDGDTAVTLSETVVQDGLPYDGGEDASGIVVLGGASLTAEACEVSASKGVGINAMGSGTVVSLHETTVRSDLSDESGAWGYGIQVADGANLEAESCELSGSQSIWILAGDAGTRVSLRSTEIQDAFRGNAIHGGEGWSREGLSKCGDAVYVRDGATPWDGSSGLLLEGNELLNGRGAGLFLDNASGTLSGNSYADNLTDIIAQGADCDLPPEGYESEHFSAQLELCPSYDYATCGDEFSLYLTLQDPESGDAGALASLRPLRPGALRRPPLPVTPTPAADTTPRLFEARRPALGW